MLSELCRGHPAGGRQLPGGVVGKSRAARGHVAQVGADGVFTDERPRSRGPSE